MHEVVAPLRERLDGRVEARHADAHALVEGDLDLGHGGQAPVDLGIGADHLDLEAGHAALAQLVERVGHAVHGADAVGDERDAERLLLAPEELALLAPEEGGCRHVRDRGDAGGEDRLGAPPARRRRGRSAASTTRSTASRSLRSCARQARRKRSACAEAVLLHPGEQLGLRGLEAERVEPGAQQSARVARAEIGRDRAGAGVALAHHALDDAQDDARVGGLAAVAAAERADRQRHRGVRPLGGAALLAAGDRVAAAQPA